VQAAVLHEPTCGAGTPPAQRSRQPPGSTPGRRVMTLAAGTSRGRSTLPSAGRRPRLPASRPSPLHSQPPAVTLSSPGPAAGPAHTPRSRAFAISDNNRRLAPAPISRILFPAASCGTSVAVNVLVTLPAPEPLISCRTAGSGGGRGAVTPAWNERRSRWCYPGGQAAARQSGLGVRPAGGLCTRPGSARPEPEQSAGQLSGRHEQPRGTQKRTGPAASCHTGRWKPRSASGLAQPGQPPAVCRVVDARRVRGGSEQAKSATWRSTGAAAARYKSTRAGILCS